MTRMEIPFRTALTTSIIITMTIITREKTADNVLIDEVRKLHVIWEKRTEETEARLRTLETVSYTHLDVYKRQHISCWRYIMDEKPFAIFFSFAISNISEDTSIPIIS